MAIDAADFESMVRSSAGRLLAVSRRILRNDSDAEDALQEAMAAGWRARDRFDGRSSIGTWMHRIVVNTSLNRLKQRTTHATRVTERPDAETFAAARDDTNALALREAVWWALDRLPEDQRSVLVLRDVERLSTEDVAGELGITPAAVRQRLHRARKHAAELLSPELCGADEMTCGGRLDLLLDMIDDELAEDVRQPVLDHVASCKTCQTYEAGYRRTINLPRKTAEDSIDLSPTLLKRLMAIVSS